VRFIVADSFFRAPRRTDCVAISPRSFAEPYGVATDRIVNVGTFTSKKKNSGISPRFGVAAGCTIACRSPDYLDHVSAMKSGRIKFILVPMEGTPERVTDKLYWRKARGEWHCFRKLAQVRGYVSLCRRQEISFVQGQQIARSEANLRCSECDGVEGELRGWTRGSGPASPRRAGSFSR
jgi:hypothetical protein